MLQTVLRHWHSGCRQSWTSGGTGSLVPHVFQRYTQKIGKAWSIMWCNDDVWTLFGTLFEISNYSPTHIPYSCVRTNDRTTATGQSACQKNISSTTGVTSSAVVIILWTASSLCHGQLSSPGPRAGPTRYLAWQREQAVHSLMMTAELVVPVVGQGYRAVILTCTLCYYCCSIVSTYTMFML